MALEILTIGLNKEVNSVVRIRFQKSHETVSIESYEEAIQYMMSRSEYVGIILFGMNEFSRHAEDNMKDNRQGSILSTRPIMVISSIKETLDEYHLSEKKAFQFGGVGYFSLPDQIESMEYLIAGVFMMSKELYEITSNVRTINTELQLVLSTYRDGVILSANDGGKISILFRNKELYSLFGYTEQQFEEEIDGEFYRLIAEEDRHKLDEEIRNSAISGRTVQKDFQVRRRDGSVIWVRIRNSVCEVDALGKQVCATVLKDVTYEKEAAERLDILNQKIAGWEVFIKLDLEHTRLLEVRSIYASEEECNQLINDIDYYEEYIKQVVYKEDRESAYQALSYAGINKHLMDGDLKYTVEYRRENLAHEMRWFAATVILMEDQGSKSLSAFIYSRDINMKMKVRLAKDHIVVTDVEDIVIINLRRASCYVVDVYSGNVDDYDEVDYYESIEAYISKHIVEEDRESSRLFFSLEYLKEEVMLRGYAEHSFWLLMADGYNRRISCKVSFLDSTHNDLMMVGRDITDLFEKEQEQQMLLQQAADLANYANEEKSRFLSRMSHDMRTPLNSIIGLIEVAKMKDSTPQTKEYLSGIDSASKYLLGLINDMLDLSKIESGNMEFHRESYPLEEFVWGINTVIRPLMDEKNIELVLNLKEEKTSIKVDKMRFTQVFYNLLSNAAKYTPVGGRVEFSSEEIPAKDGKFGMRFTVKDNGIGMSEDYLKVLFNPFTQENRPELKERRGTGLGLAIVKEIIDLVGGEIRVTSELNKGSVFMVDLYAEAVEREIIETKKKMYDSDKLKGIRIMIVDDNETNCIIFYEILNAMGCTVEIKNNGLEAVEAFQNSACNYYDIILTDLRMPIMDGFEEARLIRALDREDALTVPIIASTADAYSDIMNKIQMAGMNDRVIKPIEPDKLFEIIIRCVSERRK